MPNDANLTALGRALMKAGLVDEDGVPQAQRREIKRQEYKEASPPVVPFEPPPSGRIVEREATQPKEPEREARRDNDVPRKRGRMIWLHKTAPIFEFEDRPTLTPEDFEKGRRR